MGFPPWVTPVNLPVVDGARSVVVDDRLRKVGDVDQNETSRSRGGGTESSRRGRHPGRNAWLRALLAVALVASVGLVIAPANAEAAPTGATPQRAGSFVMAPGTPGVAQDPLVLFVEDFEEVPAGAEDLLVDYVGASGATYTAEGLWADPAACNGIITSQNSPDNAACGIASAGGPAAIRSLAEQLGTHNGSASPADNHAVAAYTAGDPGPNLIEFATDGPVPLAQSVQDRYIGFSVNVAAINCSASAPELNFFLVDGGTEYSANVTPITPCDEVATFTSSGSVLFSGSSLGIVMRNANGEDGGNDHAYDDIVVLDTTPQLDKSFAPVTVPVGANSTLTFTITNTTDLAAKTGWSFTDTLPAGLVVADTPNASSTCTNGTVTAAAGSGTIDVAGDLATGEVSCTVTVDVTSPTAATYENCAANITDSVGVNDPACSSVTFEPPPPFECASNAPGLLFQTDTVDGYEVDLVTGDSTLVAEDFYPGNINAVGFNVLDGYVYGHVQVTSPQQIVRVGADGSVEELGYPPGVPVGSRHIGDVDDNGHYWISDATTWWQIDLVSWTLVDTGSVQGGGIASWSFADWAYVPDTDGLYTIARDPSTGNTRLYRFDRANKLFENLGTLGVAPSPGYGAIYADADGFIYGSLNTGGVIHRVEVDTATRERFATGPESTSNDGARCPTSVYTDLGDAPDSYGTLLASDGARHAVPGYDAGTNSAPVMLGTNTIDPEDDGQPTVAADGDDTNGVDDESGVSFNPDLGYPSPTVRTGLDPVTLQPIENTLDVTATADGFVSVWVDWDLNGVFDPGEQVAAAEPVVAGVNEITFTQGTNPTDITTYVRVRYSTDATSIAEPTGPAPDGEVEDYQVLIERLITPDACVNNDVEYTSFTFSNLTDTTGTGGVGSTARYTGVTVVDGVAVDMVVELLAGQLNPGSGGSVNGFVGTQPGSGSSLGPQSAGWFLDGNATIRYSFYETGTTTPIAVSGAFTVNDLDGPPASQETMTFDAADLASYAVTQGSAVDIDESGGQVEFVGNGDWSGDPESRFQVVLDGVTDLEVASTGGGNTGLGFNGNGALSIQPPACDDMGDAPASYGTTLADDGARHQVVAGLFLGAQIDFDADGQPSAAADGDDTTNLDDEDGVPTPIALEVGGPTTIDIDVTNTTGATATLSGWVDLNADGDFDDPGERELVAVPASGTYQLTFDEVSFFGGETYARFRLFPGDVADPSPTGAAAGGEVEDYLVTGPMLTPFECVAGPGILFQEQPTDAYEINLITGSSSVAASDILGDLNATGYNPLDDYIYGFSSDDSGMWRLGEGYVTEPLGLPSNWTTFPDMPPTLETGRPYIGEFDADGDFWVGFASGTTMHWAEIDMDPSSPTYFEVVAAGSAVVPNALNAPWDWAYNVDDGDLYGIAANATSDSVVRFDTTTHDFTVVNDLGVMQHPDGDDVGRFGATYSDVDGFMYASDNITGGIWRTDMNTGDTVFFSSGPSSSNNDGARCFLAGLPIDLADAPDSYGTTLAADGPRHGIADYDVATNTAPLMLGSSIDADVDGVPTADADGDDLTGIDDEDGVAAPIQIRPGVSTTVTVDATNTSGEDAILAGWIDLDGSGTFDPGELQTVAVPDGSNDAAFDLTFPAPTTTDDTYARFRLFPGDTDLADVLPTGSASAGEVEDYPVVYAGLTVEKSSNPPEGTSVAPGDTVEYTVTIRNDGSVPITDTVVDDLTGVLDDATYNGDASTNLGSVTYTEPELEWTGTLQPGEEAVITYTVDVFGGDGSELTTINVLDTANNQNADGWTVTAYDMDPGCATLDPPDGTIPFAAIWGDVHGWFGPALSPVADQNLNGGGCYPGGWTGYDTAPNSWVLTKTFTSPENAVATVLTEGFRGDGGARVRINGVDAGVYGQWNQPAVDGTAYIPVTAGTNTIEIEVRDTYGPSMVQGRLDVQIVQIGDNVLENVVTGGDCPEPPITDPDDPAYDPDCHNLVPVRRIEMSKAITTGPTPVGPGQYEIDYQITVSNTGAADGTYDLDDTLQYGAGLTVASADVVNTTPGDITVNPTWDGEGDTTVATGAAIAGADNGVPTVHVYTVTVVVEVPPGTTAADADCELGIGEDGTGAFNTATMTTSGVPTDADACTELPTTEFDKQLVGTVANGDGTYTLTYELTVSREGGEGTYDLRDELRYGDAVTIDSVAVSNTTPGGITTNPGFDGTTDTLVADDVLIQQGETHTYEVVVDSTVDPTAITYANSDCEVGAAEDGSGFSNTASVEIDGQTLESDACEPIAATTVIKTTTGQPSPLGNGNYGIEYTIAVVSTGAAPDTYDLDDDLMYGDGITIVDASVANTSPGGIVTNPGWDGETDTSVVVGVPIAAAAPGDPTVHVYTVQVEVTAPQGLDPAAADCTLEPGETGTGFLNTATVDGDSGADSDDNCPPVPQTTFDKELVSQTSNGDGTYTLSYELTITRSGTSGTYDLTDDLMLNDAASVVSQPTVTNTAPGTVTVNPGFDGQSDTVIAEDVTIAAGATHTYTMDVVAAIDLADATPQNSDCTLDAGEDGTGAMNQAGLAIDGQDLDATECEPFPATSVDKEIVTGPTPLGNGQYELVYDITVTNNGAAPDTYDLDDELAYGADVTVISADVVNTSPGGITTNPSWDGTGDTSIVTGEPIDGAVANTPTVHVYTVTVVAETPATMTPGAGDCTTDPGEAGTGFTNTTTLTGDSGTSTDDDCAEVPSTGLTKTLAPVVGNGDGTYTLTYTLSVTRTGDGPVYDLTDTLQYGDAVTVESVAVTGAPTGVTPNAAFDGQLDTAVATGVPIGDGDTHEYTIEVVASIDADAVTFENSDCDTGTGPTSATGFLNTAELTVNDTTTSDDECAPLPAEPLIDKAAVSGPTPIGGGQYEIVYEITATNPGAGTGQYSLDDELQYGDGIVVVSADVANTAPGDIVTNPDWDGETDTDVVTDVDIAAATAGDPEVHTYTVTVVATAPVDIAAAAADCDVAGGETGTGFLNSATLTTNGEPAEDDECVEAPSTTIDKTLTSVTPNGDGTFSLAYELTVTRTGDGPAYTLTDELQYGEGASIDAVTASNTSPGTVPVNANYDGTADTTIAADVAIGDGETHVYEVLVDATVDPTEVTFESSDCTVTGGEAGSGFFNTATLTVNEASIDDTDCDEPPAITIDKEASGPDALGGAEFEVTYTLTVTNTGAGDGVYELADELLFGDGIVIVSAEISDAPDGVTVDPGWDGVGTTVIVPGQPIAGAMAGAPTEHVYEVSVVVSIPDDLETTAGDCDLEQGEPGTGLLNSASLGGDSGPSADADCVEPPVTELDKVLAEINPLGNRQFELVYELTATRLSGGATSYTLTDDLLLGGSLTVDDVTAVNVQPGGIVTNPAFDGDADTVIADDVAIDNGDVHEYTVTVVVTVDIDAITADNSDCQLGGGEDGTGALNSATLESDGLADEADDCVPFPSTTVAKSIIDGPTALGDGEYGVSYLITVLNAGAGDDVYDLADELRYGDGITVTSASVANVEPGTITVNPAWDGVDDTTIVSGQPIAGADGDPTVHTYRVDTVVTIAASTTPAAANCALGGSESGTGLMNSVTMESGTGEHTDDACVEPPLTNLDKRVLGVTPNGDGTTTVRYELRVERDGDGPAYDLADELQYGDDVTVDSISVTNTAPGGIATNPAFDGVGDPTVVTGRPIADGATHIYVVTVTVSVDDLDAVVEECGSGPGGAGGLANTATIDVNDVDTTADACADIPPRQLTIAKSTMPGNLVAVDPGDTVTYRVTVTNTGEAPYDEAIVDDDLSDVLDAASGPNAIRVNGPGTTEFLPGTSTLRWTGSLDPGQRAVITYEVTVVDPIGGDGWLENVVTSPTPGADCVEPGGCTTRTPIRSLHVEKRSDPGNGSTVGVGDTITYTITVTNIGQATLDPATVVDDLVGVLDDATLTGTPAATVGTVQLAGTVLTWTGDLAPDATAEIEYRVRVTGEGDGLLRNTISSDGPGSNCRSGNRQVPCEVSSVVRIPPTPELPPTGGSPFGQLRITLLLLAAGISLLVVSRRRYVADGAA